MVNLSRRRKVIIGAAIVSALTLAVFSVYDFDTLPSGYIAPTDVVGMWVLTFAVAFLSLPLLIIRRTRFAGTAFIFAAVLIPCTFFAGVKLSEMAGLIRWENAPMVRFGPDVPSNLVIYYNLGTTKAQMDEFEEYQLYQPRKDNRGKDMRSGIQQYLRLGPFEAHGHDAFALNLAPSMTQEQRDALKASLSNSPVVFAVYSDVAPLAIPDPDGKVPQPTH